MTKDQTLKYILANLPGGLTCTEKISSADALSKYSKHTSAIAWAAGFGSNGDERSDKTGSTLIIGASFVAGLLVLLLVGWTWRRFAIGDAVAIKLYVGQLARWPDLHGENHQRRCSLTVLEAYQGECC